MPINYTTSFRSPTYNLLLSTALWTFSVLFYRSQLSVHTRTRSKIHPHLLSIFTTSVDNQPLGERGSALTLGVSSLSTFSLHPLNISAD